LWAFADSAGEWVRRSLKPDELIEGTWGFSSLSVLAEPMVCRLLEDRLTEVLLE
jgi:hypothetical protein